jgi:DNA repair exonuclease SbcCD ATPase subunit
MAILFLILLLCAAVVLIALLLMPPDAIKQLYKGRPRLPGLTLNMRSDSAREPDTSAVGKDGIPAQPLASSEGKAEELSVKLKAVREDIRKLQEDIALAKDSESAALTELRKFKLGIEKDASDQENRKKEVRELADKLLEKGREYEKEFSLNLSLNKELSEYKEKCERLEGENRKLSEKLALLEGHVKAYKEELRKQAQLISELTKKNDETQWVSKKEYETLQMRLVKEKENEAKINEEGKPA